MEDKLRATDGGRSAARENIVKQQCMFGNAASSSFKSVTLPKMLGHGGKEALTLLLARRLCTMMLPCFAQALRV